MTLNFKCTVKLLMHVCLQTVLNRKSHGLAHLVANSGLPLAMAPQLGSQQSEPEHGPDPSRQDSNMALDHHMRYDREKRHQLAMLLKHSDRQCQERAHLEMQLEPDQCQKPLHEEMPLEL